MVITKNILVLGLSLTHGSRSSFLYHEEIPKSTFQNVPSVSYKKVTATHAYRCHLTSTRLLPNNVGPLSTTSHAWHHLLSQTFSKLKIVLSLTTKKQLLTFSVKNNFISSLTLTFHFSLKLSKMARTKAYARKNPHPRIPSPSPSLKPTPNSLLQRTPSLITCHHLLIPALHLFHSLLSSTVLPPLSHCDIPSTTFSKIIQSSF